MEYSTETPAEITDHHENGETKLDSPLEQAENVNPGAMTDELKEIFLVDAIGDTLYSKRFVLKTLLNLNQQDSSLTEEFEKDLCTLWDMTIEKDVVKLLLEHNVLEIFSNIVQVTEDQRLTEILIGIIGNMCTISETRDALCQQPDVMVPILDLISCSDSLILVQLMRLFHACLVFENSGDEIVWFEHFRCVEQFVEKFAFVLANSMSTSLLLNAFEALNAICTKFTVIEIQPDVSNSSGFRDMFVKPVLVGGVIEAFKQMIPDKVKTDDSLNASAGGQQPTITDDEALVPTKRTQRIINLFLDINVILSQYDKHSEESFEPHVDAFFRCISQCLEPLCQPMYLLPLSVNEQILLENVNEISQALNDIFHPTCFSQAIAIWAIIENTLTENESKTDDGEKTDDDEASEWDQIDAEPRGDNDDISASDINMTLLEYITRTSKRATPDMIKESISRLKQTDVARLYAALSAGASEDDIRDCSDKLKAAAQLLWDVQLDSK